MQHRRDAFQKYQKCWEPDFQERAALANQEDGGLFAAGKAKQRGIPALDVLVQLAEEEEVADEEGVADEEEVSGGGSAEEPDGVDAEAVEVAEEEEEEEDELSSESGELEVNSSQCLYFLAETAFSKDGEEEPVRLLNEDGDAADTHNAGDAAALPVRAYSRIVDQMDALAAAEQVKKDKAKAKRLAKASAGNQ